MADIRICFSYSHTDAPLDGSNNFTRALREFVSRVPGFTIVDEAAELVRSGRRTIRPNNPTGRIAVRQISRWLHAMASASGARPASSASLFARSVHLCKLALVACRTLQTHDFHRTRGVKSHGLRHRPKKEPLDWAIPMRPYHY